MEIVYTTLDKASKDAIKNQVDPKELKAGPLKFRAAVIDHTIGKNLKNFNGVYTYFSFVIFSFFHFYATVTITLVQTM